MDDGRQRTEIDVIVNFRPDQLTETVTICIYRQCQIDVFPVLVFGDVFISKSLPYKTLDLTDTVMNVQNVVQIQWKCAEIFLLRFSIL